MKYYLYIIVIFLFTNCSIKKNDYKLFNSFIFEAVENNDFGLGNKNIQDTVLISDKAIPILSLYNFPLNFENINKENPFYSGIKIIWKDSLKKISISDKEIEFFKTQLKKEDEDLSFNRNIFNKKYFVIKKDSIYNVNYIFNYSQTKKYLPIFNFTKPIYNQKKDFAIFGYKSSINSKGYSNDKLKLIVMKKVGKKWGYIGYEVDVGLQN